MIKIIQTPSNMFFAYDSLSNRIISIRKEHLRSIRASFDELDIGSYIANEIYSCKIAENDGIALINWPETYENYCKSIENKVPRLLIELTRRCNLRCDYCIFSGNYSHMQKHSNKSISRKELYRSISFFAEHSIGRNSVWIGFYGGEPLLEFDLLKDGIRFAKECMPSKKIEFCISTNGTKLDRNISEWLRDNPDVYLVITVNGPLHDKYRKTKAGTGSLNQITNNLVNIKENLGTVWDNQVRLIANIESVNQIETLQIYYNNTFQKKPDSISVISTDHGNKFITDLISSNRKIDSRLNDLHNTDSFFWLYIQPGVEFVKNRSVCSDSNSFPNSCFPLTEKIFVKVDGKIGFCESVCDQLSFGSINSGIDYSKLNYFYKKTIEILNRTCRTCWAQRLCPVCYRHLVDDHGRLIKSIPTPTCISLRNTVESWLSLYCELYSKQL